MGTKVQFGEWFPDLPDLENPGATVAKNVVPEFKSYTPFPSATTYSTSLGARCQGATIARDPAGNYYNYAGDASANYRLVGTSWSSTTRLVGGAYNLAADDYWEFTQFGTILIGVTGWNDDPQATTVGAANFAALAGAPPRARHIASVRDFVVMGNLSGDPQGVRWCAINNAVSWTADAATLADSQELPGDGGFVQKIIGGEYGTVFQERAVWRMTFVGSPLVFQFDKILTNMGAYAPQSVVAYRNVIFFLSESGFQEFDGSNVIPIGQGKVDLTFFAELDTAFVYRVQATVDPIRHVVAWAYPASGNTGGNPNRILLYNWSSKRWARIEDINIEFLFRSVGSAFTLEGLDAITTNLDALLISLDSQQWNGGTLTFGAFDSSHRLNLFDGSSMPATVETPELQLNPYGLTYVTEVRALTQGLSVSYTVAVGSRLNTTEAVSYTLAMSPISAGFVEARLTNRFLRFRLTTASNFTHLQGVDVTADVGGSR